MSSSVPRWMRPRWSALLGDCATAADLPPIRLLRRGGAGWGLLAFKPVDPDYGVRQIFTGTSDYADSHLAGSRGPGRASPANDRRPLRTLDQLLRPAWTLFRRSISRRHCSRRVCRPATSKIASCSSAGGPSRGISGWEMMNSRPLIPRVATDFPLASEIHATILLNLLRGEWLTRLPPIVWTGLVVVVGLAPRRACLIATVAGNIVAIASSLVLVGLVWWAFASRSSGSTGSSRWASRSRSDFSGRWARNITLKLADERNSAAPSASTFRRRWRIRSPTPTFDLTPGGRTVEATIMFTDLEGFTTLSEDLEPAEVSKTLIAYFERTTRCILENKGTIVKYVGDAVMAGWGAPIDQPPMHGMAAEAACDLRCLSDMEMRGKNLRTRIGVNTGQVLAGNLGSSFRFDYTMIGDTTNFASRLEALNKYLCTQVLISESTRKQLDNQFIVRPLGEFKVTGKAHSVFIEELLCRCDAEAGERKWIALFIEGLRLYRTGDFGGARELFQQTVAARMVSTVLRSSISNRSRPWRKIDARRIGRGVIEMTEK